ncbi:TPA: hypothetical protein EYO12_02585 [Candidatus Saccharibacteria bacterium]|nr:hypothetical protein [Candidatus Saccharibacteria bacterium]HIO88074.1 hypothetical protein [Candidatus Saccharibacteria bacterium]
MAEEETKTTDNSNEPTGEQKPGLDSQVALDSFDKKEEKKKKGFLSNFKTFNPFFIAIGGIFVVVLVVLIIVFTGSEPDTFIGADLSEDELTSLISDSSENESTGQVLRIGPATEFSQDVSVLQDVEIVGNLVVAGEIISANSSLAGQNAEDPTQAGGDDLQVDGDALFSGNIATQGSLTVNGTLTVNSSITATSITATTINSTGDATFSRHIVSNATLVVVSTGSAAGSGGTTSASGNDIAGTVTINTGSATTAGVLANIGFQQAYGSTPSVVITPVTSAAALTEYFVTRTTTGFTIQTNIAPPIGSTLQFDYHIIE